MWSRANIKKHSAMNFHGVLRTSGPDFKKWQGNRTLVFVNFQASGPRYREVPQG
jgi:hypothetical protein